MSLVKAARPSASAARTSPPTTQIGIRGTGAVFRCVSAAAGRPGREEAVMRRPSPCWPFRHLRSFDVEVNPAAPVSAVDPDAARHRRRRRIDAPVQRRGRGVEARVPDHLLDGIGRCALPPVRIGRSGGRARRSARRAHRGSRRSRAVPPPEPHWGDSEWESVWPPKVMPFRCISADLILQDIMIEPSGLRSEIPPATLDRLEQGEPPSPSGCSSS